jgi:hypothetical protein
MRRFTEEALQEERRDLSKLLEDWPRMNRRHINKNLRNSLWTRILELQATVKTMEAAQRRAKAAQARADAAASA